MLTVEGVATISLSLVYTEDLCIVTICHTSAYFMDMKYDTLNTPYWRGSAGQRCHDKENHHNYSCMILVITNAGASNDNHKTYSPLGSTIHMDVAL